MNVPRYGVLGHFAWAGLLVAVVVDLLISVQGPWKPDVLLYAIFAWLILVGALAAPFATGQERSHWGHVIASVAYLIVAYACVAAKWCWWLFPDALVTSNLVPTTYVAGGLAAFGLAPVVVVYRILWFKGGIRNWLEHVGAWLLGAGGAWFGIAGAIVVAFAAMLHMDAVEVSEEIARDPAAFFAECTGLAWPSTAAAHSAGDTRGSPFGDGEAYVIFSADRATLDRWLAGDAPWNATWQKGPVPIAIGRNCRFATPGVAAWCSDVECDGSKDRGGYTGDPGLVELLSSPKIWFAAKDDGPGSLPWHDGRIIIVDPAENRVWLCKWAG